VTLTLYESIQRIVRDELQQVRTAELAIVQEQHPHANGSDQDNYACTVALRGSQLVLREVPVATGQIGAASIPAVGDLVLIEFVGGDVNAPVIVGRLYNDEDRPPENADGKAVLHLPLGAGDSDAVHAELSSGDARKLVLKLGSGLELTLADDDPAVKIDVGGGAATLEIGKDGAVSLQSNGTVELKASEITIEAQGQLTLKGATVNLN
jgi:phage baseplate assembly protein gpV